MDTRTSSFRRVSVDARADFPSSSSEPELSLPLPTEQAGTEDFSPSFVETDETRAPDSLRGVVDEDPRSVARVVPVDDEHFFTATGNVAPPVRQHQPDVGAQEEQRLNAPHSTAPHRWKPAVLPHRTAPLEATAPHSTVGSSSPLSLPTEQAVGNDNGEEEPTVFVETNGDFSPSFVETDETSRASDSLRGGRADEDPARARASVNNKNHFYTTTASDGAQEQRLNAPHSTAPHRWKPAQRNAQHRTTQELLRERTAQHRTTPLSSALDSEAAVKTAQVSSEGGVRPPPEHIAAVVTPTKVLLVPPPAVDTTSSIGGGGTSRTPSQRRGGRTIDSVVEQKSSSLRSSPVPERSGGRTPAVGQQDLLERTSYGPLPVAETGTGGATWSLPEEVGGVAFPVGAARSRTEDGLMVEGHDEDGSSALESDLARSFAEEPSSALERDLALERVPMLKTEDRGPRSQSLRTEDPVKTAQTSSGGGPPPEHIAAVVTAAGVLPPPPPAVDTTSSSLERRGGRTIDVDSVETGTGGATSLPEEVVGDVAFPPAARSRTEDGLMVDHPGHAEEPSSALERDLALERVPSSALERDLALERVPSSALERDLALERVEFSNAEEPSSALERDLALERVDVRMEGFFSKLKKMIPTPKKVMGALKKLKDKIKNALDPDKLLQKLSRSVFGCSLKVQVRVTEDLIPRVSVQDS